jgi:hypothetical protein
MSNNRTPKTVYVSPLSNTKGMEASTGFPSWRVNLIEPKTNDTLFTHNPTSTQPNVGRRVKKGVNSQPNAPPASGLYPMGAVQPKGGRRFKSKKRGGAGRYVRVTENNSGFHAVTSNNGKFPNSSASSAAVVSNVPAAAASSDAVVSNAPPNVVDVPASSAASAAERLAAEAAARAQAAAAPVPAAAAPVNANSLPGAIVSTAPEAATPVSALVMLGLTVPTSPAPVTPTSAAA